MVGHGLLNSNTKQAIEVLKEYINKVVENDIGRIDITKRDKNKIERLLRSLARNESTTVSINALKEDIKEYENEEIDNRTIAEYLNILDKLYLLDNQKPYSPKVRSKLRMKQMEKRHFVDPSLPAVILEMNEEKFLNDLETFGFFFESLVERDLKIYAETFNRESLSLSRL